MKYFFSLLFIIKLIFFLGCKKSDSNHKIISKDGMVWIPSGKFLMGSDNNKSRKDEMPIHKVYVDGFWMDKTEVTNDQFALFVNATGYVTTAEKIPDWNELKKELPPDTPKPRRFTFKSRFFSLYPLKSTSEIEWI